ncbi:MAG: hypothetical protein ACOX0D_09065 [Sphaerochaeta sp.]|jgi:hypothetical protein
MKKIVRMLGGALVLLVMIIGLVSCDDNVAPLNTTITLPTTRAGAKEMINSFENELSAIRDEIATAKGKGIEDTLPDTFNDVKSDWDKLDKDTSGAVSYRVGLYGGSPFPWNSCAGYEVIINIATIDGFLTDKTVGLRSEFHLDLQSTFEITGETSGTTGIDGEYEFSLNASYEQDNWVFSPPAIGGTLTKSGQDSQNLTADDVLFETDERKSFEWNKGGSEAKQKILTIFVSRLGPDLEEAATKTVYTSAKDDGFHGEFESGYTIHGNEGTFTRVTWKAGGKTHTILHSEMDDFIVIDGKAYKIE